MTAESPSMARPSAEAPASEVARDMARRGLMIMPVVVGAVALIAGGAAAASVGYAMAIVMVNFLLSAYLLRWAARISLGLVASVALGGYVMRLALIFMAVWIVKDASWIRMIPLGIAIIATHLGLLVWELRHVSASFAHPGLKPTARVVNGQGTVSTVEGPGRSTGVKRYMAIGKTKRRPAVGYQPERITERRRGFDSDTLSGVTKR